MTRKTPLWQQSGTYSADVDRLLIAAAFPGGGVIGGAVTPVNNTMTVSVAPGTAAVPLASGQGSGLCVWDAAEVVPSPPIVAPGAGTSRIDLVIVQYRDSAFDGGGNNDFIVSVVTGAPAASPVAPVVPANALALAQILIPPAVANLNTATVTPAAVPLNAPIPHSSGAQNPGSALSWVQNGWGNWPPGAGAALVIPFTKYRADTVLRVFCSTTTYIGTSNAGRVQVGFRIGTNGGDRSVVGKWLTVNAQQPREMLAGEAVVTGYPAGPIAGGVIMRANWPGSAAGDSINFGTNEFATMTVTEEFA